MAEPVLYVVDGNVARITLHRPVAANAADLPTAYVRSGGAARRCG